MKTSIISRSDLRRMRNVSDKSCTEYQNTHFMFNNFLLENTCSYDYVEKYIRAERATDKNMAHAHCTLDT
jgi:hypothetical protein